jgi:branched-chain amino acid transport system substrate-binding protein
MKKILMATVATTAPARRGIRHAHGKSVTLGVILGFTGPAESLDAGHGRRRGARDGRSHRERQSADGRGMSVSSIRADSTCVDSCRPPMPPPSA